MTKKAIIAFLLWNLLLLGFQTSVSGADRVKNVIVLIPDGMGSTHTTIARWYKGKPLALDGMFLGGIRTYGAESIITDSAAASTAFATGHKSSANFIGVLPEAVTIPEVPIPSDDRRMKPVASVLKAAKVYGKSVGLITTSNIQHATPAAYSSHWPDRSNYEEIAEQQVYLGIDVVFGGGKKYLLPKAQGGTRTDGENMIEVLQSRGYTFLQTREQMMNFQGEKVWGLFSDDAMAYEFDRKTVAPGEPSLSEMTQKAIEILSRNEKGFFLLVEGGKVDWASHANDPIGVISDVLAFDDAVCVALAFAKKERHTLVLAFTDHGNGGMSLGSQKTASNYAKLPINALIEPLKKAKLTGEGVERMLKGDLSEENIRKSVSKYYGVNDLTREEISALQKSKKGTMNSVLGPILSKRSVIGWTTTGHTGEDLFFYHYGLSRPIGMIENTQIAHLCAEGLGVDLDHVDRRLFVRAEEAFPKIGASVMVDDQTDPANPKLIVAKGKVTAELPFSKNVIRVRIENVGTFEYEMEGLTVFAPKTKRVYVPLQAIEWVNSFSP